MAKKKTPSRKNLLKACEYYKELCETNIIDLDPDDDEIMSTVCVKLYDIIRQHFAELLHIKFSYAESTEDISLLEGTRKITVSGEPCIDDAYGSFGELYWETLRCGGNLYDMAFQNSFEMNINCCETWGDIQSVLFFDESLQTTEIDDLIKIYKEEETQGKCPSEMSDKHLRTLFSNIVKMFEDFSKPKEIAEAFMEDIMNIFSCQYDSVDISYLYYENVEIIPFSRWLWQNKDAYRKDKLVFDTIISIIHDILYISRCYTGGERMRRIGDSIIWCTCEGGYNDGYLMGLLSFYCNWVRLQIGIFMYESLMDYIKRKYGFSV